MFGGDSYDERFDAYKAKEDEEDDIFWNSIDKLSSIATIWYMSGVQQQEDFDTLLQEISDDVTLDEPEQPIDDGGGTEEAVDTEEAESGS